MADSRGSCNLDRLARRAAFSPKIEPHGNGFYRSPSLPVLLPTGLSGLSLEYQNSQPVAGLGGKATGKLVAFFAQTDFQGVAFEGKDSRFRRPLAPPLSGRKAN